MCSKYQPLFSLFVSNLLSLFGTILGLIWATFGVLGWLGAGLGRLLFSFGFFVVLFSYFGVKFGNFWCLGVAWGWSGKAFGIV